jgi:hypothetical protein
MSRKTTPTYVLLNQVTLAAASSTVTFSNIPQTYGDLVLVCNSKLVTGPAQDQTLYFNGDSGANYSVVIMWGDGSTRGSQPYSGQTNLLIDFYGSVDTAFSNVTVVQIMDYSATDKHKVVLSRANRASSGVDAIAGRWANTNAITSITYFASGRTFDAGSTVSLYGVYA